AAACALLTSANGCSVLPSWWGPPKKDTPPAAAHGAVESMVLRDGGLESEAVPADGTPAGDLEGAKRLFHEKEYAKAEPIFHRVPGGALLLRAGGRAPPGRLPQGR